MKNPFKIRHVVAGIIIALSVVLTPWAVQSAYIFRGYWAFGGEWLLVQVGLFVAAGVLRIGELIEDYLEWARTAIPSANEKPLRAGTR